MQTNPTSLRNYPTFGSVMQGREYANGAYRFGFNNQEKESSFSEKYFYKYRIHDPRLGRFLCVDPLSYKFPWNSTYSFSENRLLDGKELEGLEVVLIGGVGNVTSFGVSGTAEVGIALDISGAYSIYFQVGLGVETSMGSASAQVSVTFYPTMSALVDLEGFGWDAQVNYGEGVVGSSGISESSGYIGYTQTLGVGANASPGTSVSGHVNYTFLKNLNLTGKKEMLNKLYEANMEMSIKETEIRSNIGNLEEDNRIIRDQLFVIDNSLENDASLSDSDKEKLNKSKTTLNQQRDENNSKLTSLNESLDKHFKTKEIVDKVIIKLDADIKKEEKKEKKK